MLELEAIPNSGKPRGYRCRCTRCGAVTQLLTPSVAPGRQVKLEELKPLLQTLLSGKLLPEPQGEWNLHLKVGAEKLVKKWMEELKKLNCEHHYIVVRK